MALMQIAYAGFKRYQKRRRNFTIILIGSYFLICFFMSFFVTANRNINYFWVKSYVGGDIVVSKNLKRYDFLHPVPPEYFFNYHKFLTLNSSYQNKVSPCLRIGALLQSKKTNDRSCYCIVNGVDSHNLQALEQPLKLFEGRLFQNDQNEVVLPESIAANLKAKIGDQINIYVVTKDGYPNFEMVKVVGFLDISLGAQTYFRQTMVYMPINKIRELTTVGNDDVSEIISIKNRGIFPAFLQGNYRNISGVTSFSMARSLFYAFGFLRIVILLLIFVVAASSIYHNVGLMNSEREKEIGIYLTNGAQPSWIRRLLFYELFIYTIYCSVLGGIISYLAISGFNNLGFYPINIPTQLLMACNHFTITNYLGIYLISFLIMLGLMIVGSAGPIWESTGINRITKLFHKTV